MPAPVVASYSAAVANSAASITPSAPSGTTAGDLLVAVVIYTSARTLTAPSGWTLAGNLIDGADGRQGVYTRPATGSDPLTWSLGVAGNLAILLLRITGADTTTPIVSGEFGLATDAGYTTTHDSPSITTTGPDRLVLRSFTSSRGRAIASGPGTLVGQTSGGTFSAAAAWQSQPTAGATGTGTWTQSSSGNGAVCGTVAIAPAAGAPAIATRFPGGLLVPGQGPASYAF